MAHTDEKSSHPSPQRSAAPRREFLKGAAALGGAAAALSVTAPKLHAAGSDVIRIALIGCGGRGRGAALNAMAADPKVRLVALADLFDQSITDCRKQLTKQKPDQVELSDETCFVGFDAYKKAIELADVVLLASPPHYRPDHLEAAVAADKHIFCEKPIATDATGVRRVLAICEEADKKNLNIVSGLCWRYDQGVRETMGQIFDGKIGRVIGSQANYLTGPVWIRPRKDGESEMAYQCRNWYYFNWLSGDHITEQFIHSLDKALWLRHDEPPVKAYGMGGRGLRSDLTQGDIFDHFAVVYEWADGSTTNAFTRQVRGAYNQVEDFVYGSDGKASVLANKIEGKNSWKFDGKDKVNMYQQEHNELFEAVQGKRPRINNGTYMCRSTLLAILGREVCYSGKEITWDEAINSPQDLRPQKYSFDAEAPAVKVPKPGVYKFPIAKPGDKSGSV
ncbi:Putative 4,5-dihydroxyphthalate dehydrogenase [Roseimaritima multifibrata]|uniref:4,5-dihydroxyphthalate dehydrogenase n=1 Tax=Roseimaritima multifibrata TaxID=1930274 RepID=A0A517MB36_9BACT|nr:Gfo/Idh/MocA family oxidoreductase [Roseimaritima multifibrata]QDS92100.1 Putative 4,5-dihydroxyphthalate dehydrogenase [Roseimaritima multifibrata]